jgi:hypothetical protein
MIHLKLKYVGLTPREQANSQAHIMQHKEKTNIKTLNEALHGIGVALCVNISETPPSC